MRRFRFRRRSFGGFARKVRRVTGITLTKRVQCVTLTLPDITSADFDNELDIPLIDCLEAQNDEIESDGTNVATVPIYSRLTSLKLHFNVQVAGGASATIRYMLLKRPDGETAVGSLTDSFFHTSNDDPTSRENRKNVLAKGQRMISASATTATIPITVSRDALKRNAQLRENDRISLIVAKNATGTTGLVDLWGSLWVRANA